MSFDLGGVDIDHMVDKKCQGQQHKIKEGGGKPKTS